MLLAWNSLKDFLQKYLTKLFFASDLSRLTVNVLEANTTKKLENIPHQFIPLILIIQQSPNFGDEGSWPANLWKGQKVESALKIEMVFPSFMD